MTTTPVADALAILLDAGYVAATDGRVGEAVRYLQAELDLQAEEKSETLAILNEALEAVGEPTVASLEAAQADDTGPAAIARAVLAAVRKRGPGPRVRPAQVSTGLGPTSRPVRPPVRPGGPIEVPSVEERLS